MHSRRNALGTTPLSSERRSRQDQHHQKADVLSFPFMLIACRTAQMSRRRERNCKVESRRKRLDRTRSTPETTPMWSTPKALPCVAHTLVGCGRHAAAGVGTGRSLRHTCTLHDCSSLVDACSAVRPQSETSSTPKIIAAHGEHRLVARHASLHSAHAQLQAAAAGGTLSERHIGTS